MNADQVNGSPSRAKRTRLEPVKVLKDEHGEAGHDTGEAAQQLASKMEEVGKTGRQGAIAIRGQDHVPAGKSEESILNARVTSWAKKEADVIVDGAIARIKLVAAFVRDEFGDDPEKNDAIAKAYRGALTKELHVRFNVPQYERGQGAKLRSDAEKKVLNTIASMVSQTGAFLRAAALAKKATVSMIEGKGTWHDKLKKARELSTKPDSRDADTRQRDDQRLAAKKREEATQKAVEAVEKFDGIQMITLLEMLGKNLMKREHFALIGKQIAKLLPDVQEVYNNSTKAANGGWALPKTGTEG